MSHSYVQKESGRLLVNFTLESAEKQSSIYSTTFKIPARKTREQVQIGDLVKLIFTVFDGEGSKNPFNGEMMYPHSLSERLWVRITHKTDNGCLRLHPDTGDVFPCEGGARLKYHTKSDDGRIMFRGVVHSHPALVKDIIPSDSIEFSPEHISDISHTTKENK